MENFLVDDVMSDRFVDFDAPVGSSEHLNVNFMLHAGDLSIDPGWDSFWANQQASCVNIFHNQVVSTCPHADKLWMDFFAPPAWSDKVDNELLDEVHLQKKGKGAAPVGRKQKKKAKTSSSDADASSEAS